MSATPEVKIMRGGAVGSRKKSRTAMKFMARNQLRNCVQWLRRCVKTQTMVPMMSGRCRRAVRPHEEVHERRERADAALDPGSQKMPMAFSRFMKKRPLAMATASRP